MSRRAFLSLVVIMLAAAGFAGFQTLRFSHQSAQLAALRQRAAELTTETAKLRRSHDAANIDLAAAERQLAALPASDTVHVDPERRSEMKAWLARVKKLQRLFDERPDQRIPEMQFLTDQDWLRVAKNLRLESEDEVRMALAAIRDAAGTAFRPRLSAALRKYAAAGPQESGTVSALTPYFDAPVDPRLLERYELSKTSEGRPQWRVQTKIPIDPDFDSRHYTSVQLDGHGWGGGSESAPIAWMPGFREQMIRAYQAYAVANKGAAAHGLGETLPFFDPPLAPTLADKLIKAEQRQLQKFFGP
jgi:hypothetical protein